MAKKKAKKKRAKRKTARQKREARNRAAARKAKTSGTAVEVGDVGLRLADVVVIEAVKESMVQHCGFFEIDGRKIEAVLMQNVEMHVLGNVIIIQGRDRGK